MASRYLNARTRNILLATTGAVAVSVGFAVCAAPALNAHDLFKVIVGGLTLTIMGYFKRLTAQQSSGKDVQVMRPFDPSRAKERACPEIRDLLKDACSAMEISSRPSLMIMDDSMPVSQLATYSGGSFRDEIAISRSFFVEGLKRGPEAVSKQEISAVLMHEIGHSLRSSFHGTAQKLCANALMAGAVTGAATGSLSLAFAGVAGWAATAYLPAFTSRQIEFLCDRESLCVNNDPVPMSRILAKFDLYCDIIAAQKKRSSEDGASVPGRVFDAALRFNRRMLADHPSDTRRIAELFAVSGRGPAPASVLSPEEKKDFTRFIESGLNRAVAQPAAR